MGVPDKSFSPDGTDWKIPVTGGFNTSLIRLWLVTFLKYGCKGAGCRVQGAGCRVQGAVRCGAVRCGAVAVVVAVAGAGAGAVVVK